MDVVSFFTTESTEDTEGDKSREKHGAHEEHGEYRLDSIPVGLTRWRVFAGLGSLRVLMNSVLQPRCTNSADVSVRSEFSVVNMLSIYSPNTIASIATSFPVRTAWFAMIPITVAR